MKRVGVVVNLHKANALSSVGMIVDWLEKHGATALLEQRLADAMGKEGVPLAELPAGCEILIALGGDGTLLSVARHACRTKTPLLGVNLGGLGFLTELAISEVIPALERIWQAELAVEERMMLEARIEDGSGNVTSRYVCEIVNQFDGGTGPVYLPASPSTSPVTHDAENRPYSLAATEHGVGHGPVNGRGPRRGRRQHLEKRRLDPLPFGKHESLEKGGDGDHGRFNFRSLPRPRRRAVQV